MTSTRLVICINVCCLLGLLFRTCRSNSILVILILHSPVLERRNKVELDTVELAVLLPRLLHLLRMRLRMCKTTAIAVVSQCPGIHTVLEDEVNVLRRIAKAIHSAEAGVCV